jgi:predicted dithiol-disulfide oxidoreductase (DUF899 family)
MPTKERAVDFTLDREIVELSQQIEALKAKLSAARRRRPAEPVADYELRGTDGVPVSLSALFGDKDDLIVVHNMGRGCPYCTLWADGFNGVVPHLEDRAAFVVVSPDEPAVQASFAESRGWRFRMVSGAGSDFIGEMGYLSDDGGYLPGVSAFHREPDGSIVRTGRDVFGPGDDYCSPWRLFDLLGGGVGEWEPRYRYVGAGVHA